jgi:hypothetical protein
VWDFAPGDSVYGVNNPELLSLCGICAMLAGAAHKPGQIVLRIADNSPKRSMFNA